MAFTKIQEYITTDTGTAGTLLIPKLIMPTLMEEVDKNLLPRELAAMVFNPNQIQGSTFNVNQIDPDSMNVREVGEGAEIPMDALDYSTVSFTPKKYGVAIRITREMMEDSQFALLQRNIRYAGKRMAEKETELILDALNGATNSVSGGAAITIANIAEAMNYLEQNDYTPTDILVGDEVLQDLRNIDTFVEADKAGNTEMLTRGFLGTIYGMNVVRFSRNATSAPSTFKLYAYVIDRSQAYGIAIKRDITVENFDLPTYDMQGAAITMRIDVQLLRDKAVCEIT
ncbi:MAG: phage major capsid protein, partial [Candidatus Thorarchaeota archaeon]